MDPSLRYGGLSLVLGLAIGIVGANAFGDAAGFPHPSTTDHEPAGAMLRVLCGTVLFFVSWMLLRFLFQLGFQIVWRLGEVRERPGLPITITLLACGTRSVVFVASRFGEHRDGEHAGRE